MKAYGRAPGSRDVPSDRRIVGIANGIRIWLRKPDGVRTAYALDIWHQRRRLKFRRVRKWPA